MVAIVLKNNHSRRYMSMKKVMPQEAVSPQEAFNFFLENDKGKSRKIRATFTLNWKSKQTKPTLKTTLSLPHGVGIERKLLTIKDGLPADLLDKLATNTFVELLTISDLLQRLVDPESKKVKNSELKKLRTNFKIIITPENEQQLKPLEKELKALFPNKKNGGVIPQNDLLATVARFNAEEQPIKSDKGGNLHIIVGTDSLSLNQLVDNYQASYKVVTGLRTHDWKGVFLNKVTLSENTGPGIKIKI